MTAREHLDQLDKLRAKGTPGEWRVGFGTDIASGVKQADPGIYIFEREVCQIDDLRENDVEPEADAALIVAAVNALPELTVELRAVLDLADQWDTDDDPRLNRNRIAKGAAAQALRDAVGVLGGTA